MKNLLAKKDILSVSKLTEAIKELWIQELTVNFLQKLYEFKWG
jgi:hypothetical protein